MGNQFSKRREKSRRGRPQGENSDNNSNNLESGDEGATPEPDLSSYEAACQADPQLRNLDAAIQQRASRAINSVAVGLDVGQLSLDSLRDVTECLLDMNQDVVSIILQSKKDIWKNRELFDLVDEYFKNSLQNLDFCAALEACLNRALNSQSRINLALQKFKEEHANSEGPSVYSKTLEELRHFKESGHPFTEEFFSLLQAVYKQQVLMLEKLQAKRRKLDKKLSKLKTWRKVTNIIFVTAFVSVLICSVVAAAVTAPPVVTALTAAAAVPLGSMGKWLNSIWTKWERELKGQREIMFSMQFGSYVVVKDLENIRVLVEKFQIEIESLMQNAEFAMREDAAVAIAVNEIRKKIDGFTKTIQDLSVHADKCSRDINRTRTMILRRIINQPNNSDGSTSSDFEHHKVNLMENCLLLVKNGVSISTRTSVSLHPALCSDMDRDISVSDENIQLELPQSEIPDLELKGNTMAFQVLRRRLESKEKDRAHLKAAFEMFGTDKASGRITPTSLWRTLSRHGLDFLQSVYGHG